MSNARWTGGIHVKRGGLAVVRGGVRRVAVANALIRHATEFRGVVVVETGKTTARLAKFRGEHMW